MTAAARALEEQAKEIAELRTRLSAARIASEEFRLDVARLEAKVASLTSLGEVVARDVARLEGEVETAKPLLDEALAYDALLSSMGIPRIGAPIKGERAWNERELRKADIGLTMAARAFAKTKEAKT